MTTITLDFELPLRNPSDRELRRLLRRLQRRDRMTPLEEVAREVGPAIYAVFLLQLAEFPVLIRRGRVVALPPGTYSNLLREVLSRRLAGIP
jgi:hypothetical protein